MKKFYLIMALMGVALGFTSCSEDRDPKYKDPTQFKLNEPAMMDQYIVLQENNTLELSCSQPDYGFSAVANYSAEMSLSPDFAETVVLNPINNHVAKMYFKQNDVALGICKILGIDSEDVFNQKYPDGFSFMPVYFRAICQISGVASSRIVSNTVQYNHIQPYFAVATQGVMYLVGNVTGYIGDGEFEDSGWKDPSASNADYYQRWRLLEPEDAFGSKVFYGTFDLPAASMIDGGLYFRFYSALTGWDDDSYGTQEADEAVQYPEWTDAVFSAPMVKGKGAYAFPNYVGGMTQIVIDMSDPSNFIVTMTPVQ